MNRRRFLASSGAAGSALVLGAATLSAAPGLTRRFQSADIESAAPGRFQPANIDWFIRRKMA